MAEQGASYKADLGSIEGGHSLGAALETALLQTHSNRIINLSWTSEKDTTYEANKTLYNKVITCCKTLLEKW